MEIKIQCSCGTRYAFEVEPVNGWMPVRVKCPGCGVDGTDVANDILRQSRAAAAAAPGPVPQPTPAPAQPSQPVAGLQPAIVQEKQRRMGTLIWRAAIFLMVIFLGAWIWYAFFGSHPRVVYLEKIPRGDRARSYQFFAPGQVLSLKANQMALFDVTGQRQLWSVALNSENSRPGPSNPALANAGDDLQFFPNPHVVATVNDFWILFPDRIVQCDRHTGNRRQIIPLNPPVFGMAQNENGITVISSDDAGREIITRIALPAGAIQTELVASAGAGPLPSDSQPKPPDAAPATDGQPIIAPPVNVPGAKAGLAVLESFGDRYVPAGASVVQVKTGLIERKTITHQAMEPPKKSLVEDNLTAGQSLKASEQAINDMRREQTGGVEEENASRYQVTLRRCPANRAPDWTGEVIGSPTFFALKTLDVLVGANSIYVFDKNNKKLWTASLTYPIAPHYSEDFATEADPPCVEAGGALYVFDKGMLTSFDAATGQVHWRLTSAGISQVQPDGKGNLYVTSPTASPEAIQFSRRVNLSSRANPVILKVDAATGRVLWRAEGIADQCFLSGKFVYAARATVDPLSKPTPGEDPVLSFDLYRLNPSNGQTMWRYSQSHHPLQIEVQGNQILLHFRGELQVLKFLSL